MKKMKLDKMTQKRAFFANVMMNSGRFSPNSYQKEEAMRSSGRKDCIILQDD
jgi:hypothetical protein